MHYGHQTHCFYEILLLAGISRPLNFFFMNWSIYFLLRMNTCYSVVHTIEKGFVTILHIVDKSHGFRSPSHSAGR